MNWYPGCGGCCEGDQLPSCIRYQDEFDDSTIDPIWNQLAGSWVEDAGGYLRTSSENAVIAISDALSPAYAHYRLFSRIWQTELAQEAFLWNQWIDSTHRVGVKFYAGEFGLNYGLIILWRENGSSIFTTYAYTEFLDRAEWHNVQLCIQADAVSSNYLNYDASILNDDGNRIAYVRSANPLTQFAGTPSYTGLGTGQLEGGQTRFDIYRQTYTAGGAPYAACPICPALPFVFDDTAGVSRQAYFLNGISPDKFVVDISGVTAGGCVDSSCEDFWNTMFVVDPESLNVYPQSNVCNDPPSFVFEFRLHILLYITGTYGLRIEIRLEETWQSDISGGTRTFATFIKNYPDGVRAADIIDIDIPLSASAPFSFCSGAAATVTLTSIL